MPRRAGPLLGGSTKGVSAHHEPPPQQGELLRYLPLLDVSSLGGKSWLPRLVVLMGFIIVVAVVVVVFYLGAYPGSSVPEGLRLAGSSVLL